jgi:hypothetical protein
VDRSEEISGGLVVASGNCAVLLELAEEVLHQVTRLVHLSLSKVRWTFRLLLGGITSFFPAARRGSMTRWSASKALSAAARISSLLLPHAALGPAGESRVKLYRIAKAFRQVTPVNASAIPVKHRLNKQSIVLGGETDMPFTAGQQVLYTLPLVIPKGIGARSIR